MCLQSPSADAEGPIVFLTRYEVSCDISLMETCFLCSLKSDLCTDVSLLRCVPGRSQCQWPHHAGDSVQQRRKGHQHLININYSSEMENIL